VVYAICKGSIGAIENQRRRKKTLIWGKELQRIQGLVASLGVNIYLTKLVTIRRDIYGREIYVFN